MKQIALVGVTMNSIPPMMRALEGKEVKAVHYLDSYILEKNRKAGHMTDDCMRRMVNMVAHACEDGADGVIITCTIFSKYVSYFREMFSAPIVAADQAMMEQAGKAGGRIALLCTFEGTREISYQLLKLYCELSRKSYEIVPFVLKEAYEEAQKSNLEVHNQMIREKILEIEGDYDQIVLAQMSMADSAAGLKTRRARVLTSPAAAYETVMEEIKKRKISYNS